MNMCEERMSVDRTPKHLKPYEFAKTQWKQDIKEYPGKEKNNPKIVWYHSFTTLRATDDETPWCSSFMNACAFMGGYQGTRSAAAISWESYGLQIALEDVQPGDVIVTKRFSSTNPRARHVTFFHNRVTVGGKAFWECLGGNQSNTVCVTKIDPKTVVAVRRFPA